VANYDVDINIALQGSDRLRALSTALRQVTKDVGKLNAKTIKIGKELDKTFKKAHIENADNYSKAVKRAERALRKAAAGTREEREAISMVVRARKEANAELERQNALLKEEERIQGVIKVKASDRVSVRSPLASPVFGARDIEGSPMARDFGFEPKKKRGGGAKPAGVTAGKRFGAAVSAGAFPLLFGGGPLMSLGGAAGGAISGSTFGPAAIALQVLGGALDGFVAQVAMTGQALNKFTFDFTEVTRAAGLAGTATATYIAEIEKLADSTEAQEIATRALAINIGQDGVDSLKRFGDASADASRQFAQSMTMLGAAISEVAGPVAQFVANALASGNLLRAGRANATQDPELQRLAEQEQSLLRGNFDGSTQERMMEIAKVQEQIRDRQKEINIVLQETTRIRAEDLQRLDNELSIQTDNLHVLALRRELLQNGKELSEEELAIAKENIEKGRIQVKRERLLLEQAQLIERAKKGELSFRKVALIIAGKQLELDEALQKLETKGSDKTGPKSRALQLQAAILREKLKQFGIEMDVQSLNETTVQSLQRQNKGIEERRDKEIQILEFQRQQEIANNKVAGDTKFINKLYDERKQTVRDTLGLELDQNNARIKAIELQQKLTRMRADQQTAGIGRGLRRQIEDAQRGMANPFDSNELQMLQLRVDQVRRSDDAYRSLNERIAENNKIIAEGDPNKVEKARAENEVLRERISIYQNLLPQLEAVEQAQLRQQQIIDQLTPATEAFAGALVDTVTGAQTAQEAFANFLRSVANMLADTAKKMIAQYIAIGIARMFAGLPSMSSGQSIDISAANAGTVSSLGGLGADGLPGIGFRANGGPVSARTPYIVGERGPELFVPGAQGNIVPNNAMGSTSVVVNVDASGTEVQGNQGGADQLGRLIGAAVQAELIKQKRPGGLLTR
jgi:hypothetical protein